MGTVIDDRHAATEFKPLFEVLLPSVYNDSIATAISQQSSREDKALSRSRKSNQKAGTSSSGPKRHHSQATPERKAGSAEADQPIKNRWTCAALSSRVPGIFMGHANGQVWHWHAAAVPAAEVLQDQDTPDKLDVQPWRPVPRRQVLQLICTQKGPVTALLGPKGPRCLPDPAAQRSSRFSAGDQHPAGPAAGAEPHLDQVFTAGHDGAIRVWETHRLGVLSRRLVACATLVQVLEGHQSTVTALAHRHRYLISSSTDQTIIIWRTTQPPQAWHQGNPRWEKQELLMAMDSWVTSLSYAAADTVSDNCGQLFMTDDTGKVAGAQPIVQDIRQAWLPASLISWVTKGPTPPSSSQAADLARYPAVPRRIQDRAAIQILYVPELDVLLTIARDSCMRIMDPATYGLRSIVSHPAGRLFTAIACHVHHAEVLLADDMGWVMTYGIEAERFLSRQQVTEEPIVGLLHLYGPGPTLAADLVDGAEPPPKGSGMLSRYLQEEAEVCAVLCASSMRLLRVRRQSGYQLLCAGPTAPIVALQAMPSQDSGEQRAGSLLSAAAEGGLSLWHPNVNGDLLQHALPVPTSEITSMAMAVNNTPMTGHEDGSLVVWNLETGTHHLIGRHANTVTCLASAQLPTHGLTILSSGYDGRLCMWAAHGRQGLKAAVLLFTAQLEAGQDILSLLMDSNGSFVLCGCRDGKLAVFYTQSLQEAEPVKGAPEAVTTLAMTCDWLVAGTEAGTICQWSTHARTGLRPSTSMGCLTQVRQAKPIITAGGGHAIVGLCILPNPEFAASCTSSGLLRAWHLSSEDIVAQLDMQQELTSMVIRATLPEPDVVLGTTAAGIVRWQWESHAALRPAVGSSQVPRLHLSS
ncbi:hypothetical protein WJX84_001737 [Apatococcus fuscideae]|uniref:Uncharacterized protein n=1 Tax=Apatococcus fuscideae TaxID=2026836 RepID=A0AAW1SVW0_9CHLO